MYSLLCYSIADRGCRSICLKFVTMPMKFRNNFCGENWNLLRSNFLYVVEQFNSKRNENISLENGLLIKLHS